MSLNRLINLNKFMLHFGDRSNAQLGAALRLCVHYSQLGTLPDKKAALARIASVAANKWTAEHDMLVAQVRHHEGCVSGGKKYPHQEGGKKYPHQRGVKSIPVTDTLKISLSADSEDNSANISQKPLYILNNYIESNNTENANKMADVVAASASMIDRLMQLMQKSFPSTWQTMAVNAGVPVAEVDEALREWATYHVNTEFAGEGHLRNSWALHCRNRKNGRTARAAQGEAPSGGYKSPAPLSIHQANS